MSDSLITPKEAEAVSARRGGPIHRLRTPLMLILGAVTLAIATLLVLIIFSISSSRTGLDVLFPSLDKKPTTDLKL